MTTGAAEDAAARRSSRARARKAWPAEPPSMAVEEANQLRALPVGQSPDRFRLADAALVEEARRLHAAELRHRHQDVEHLRGRDVLGRVREDRLDPHASVF